MTTCAKALQAWAAKEETPLEDAKMVKIYAQIPPISKLDNSLNQLVNCERLSLSTNSIDRLIPLPGLKSLKILSVGRNNLKKIDDSLVRRSKMFLQKQIYGKPCHQMSLIVN